MGRSVPPNPTKGATCMLIHRWAFREGSGAEAEGLKCVAPFQRARGGGASSRL